MNSALVLFPSMNGGKREMRALPFYSISRSAKAGQRTQPKKHGSISNVICYAAHLCPLRETIVLL